MITNPTSADWGLKEAAEAGDEARIHRLRWQAEELLTRLYESRQRSEQRALEMGQRDPIKSITGHSALDSAISATRGMIDKMDELLSELDGEFAAYEPQRAACAAKVVGAGSAT